MKMNGQQTVKTYHERSKHGMDHYADGPGHLDWDTQPNPVRNFAGCKNVELPFNADSILTPYATLFGGPPPDPYPLDIKGIAALMELSAGISAWKAFGDTKWALRCNPSSGNLHPSEFYMITGGASGIAAGVYHYDPYNHSLEMRCAPPAVFGDKLPDGSIIVGLSFIQWREEWKYGERAFRYCQLDIGHAIASVRTAAASLGWKSAALMEPSDETAAKLMGIDRLGDFENAEKERAALLIHVSASANAVLDNACIEEMAASSAAGRWCGSANIISYEHEFFWPEAEKAAEATIKPATVEQPWAMPTIMEPQPTPCEDTAAHIIRKRRSAQAFDGRTVMSEEAFYRMLDITLPRLNSAPWDTLSWSPRAHIILFVHRVEGLNPGIYAFLRREGVFAKLRAAMRPQFDWIKPDNAPPHLPLFHLASSDAQKMAQMVCCFQDIAAMGAFSVGILTEFDGSLENGAWWYKRLFWEAGMIGHCLYLEAVAAGMSGTGIGCFFDDSFHDILGLRGASFQSLYHFTVGAAVEDSRPSTLPAYSHINGR